jgi:hypothetical protein
LQIPVVVATTCTAWQYVINRRAFSTALLACELIAFKDSLPDLAPFASASIVLQCACH